MFKPKKLLLFFSLLALPCLVFAEESITITTYYPSPYGSYNQLYVADKLGIGTTGPSDLLHIVGTAPSIRLQDLTPLPTADFRLKASGDNFQIDDLRTSTTPFFIQYNGNVGIGTTAPGAELDIFRNTSGYIGQRVWNVQGGNPNNSGSQLLLAEDWTGSPLVPYTQAIFRINGASSTQEIGDAYDIILGGYNGGGAPGGRDLKLITDNTPRLTILQGGNVGIGTTGPGDKLDVQGGSPADLGPGRISITGTADYTAGLNFHTASSTRRGFVGWRGFSSTAPFNAYGMYLINYDNSNLILGTNSLERVRIDTNGNVGIGTTNPKRALHLGNSGELVFENPSMGVDQKIIRLLNRGSYLEIGTTNDAVTTDQTMIASFGRNGNVGIGTAGPGYTLTVNGTAWCTSGAWSGSDLRWKKNVETLNNPLDKLSRLRGVSFDWKREEFKSNNFLEGRQIGIIAQELEKEFPELVTTDKQGYKAIAYDRFTAVLLEAIKELKSQNDTLKARISSLEEKVGGRQ